MSMWLGAFVTSKVISAAHDGEHDGERAKQQVKRGGFAWAVGPDCRTMFALNVAMTVPLTVAQTDAPDYCCAALLHPTVTTGRSHDWYTDVAGRTSCCTYRIFSMAEGLWHRQHDLQPVARQHGLRAIA